MIFMTKYVSSPSEGLKISLEQSMTDVLNRIIRIPPLDNVVGNKMKELNNKFDNEIAVMSVVCGSATLPFNDIINKKKFQSIKDRGECNRGNVPQPRQGNQGP